VFFGISELCKLTYASSRQVYNTWGRKIVNTCQFLIFIQLRVHLYKHMATCSSAVSTKNVALIMFKVTILCDDILFHFSSSSLFRQRSEFHTRLSRAQEIGVSLQKIWKSHSIPISTKIRLMKALVRTVAKYGCESRILKKNEEKKHVLRPLR